MRTVLISAYACEPNRGSECEIGWRLVHEIARYNKVWVITRKNNRQIHEAQFRINPKPRNLRFIYYDLPKWARWYKRGKRGYLIYYFLWQLGTVLEVRRLLRHQKINLVHHLTGGMDWMPSGLAFVKLPFVWGPIGSEEIHPVILDSLPIGVRVKESFRKISRYICRTFNPLVLFTGYRADLILSHTPNFLPKRYGCKLMPFMQTGIFPAPSNAMMKSNFDRGDIFTVIYAGELVHWKGAVYALDAFIRFSRTHSDVQMLVIGDGKLLNQLKLMVLQNSVGNSVHFLGKLPMHQLVEKLVLGDVFLYPSYHHGLANILLQAMLTGLPTVCLEGDATGRAVGTECGVTVRLSYGDDFVDGLAQVLERLYEDEVYRISLARHAQKTALSSYDYAGMGKKYEEIYQNVLE